MEKIYFDGLKKLKEIADAIPNTKMMAIGKIHALIELNMRYELLMVNRELDTHPYILVEKLVNDTCASLRNWAEIAFIEENPTEVLLGKDKEMEANHKDLFQKLWVNYSPEDYLKRIEQYKYRLNINDLSGQWFKGKKCIDFGCGHGNFAHALLSEGAASVYGLDVGADSIKFASNTRDSLGVNENQLEFHIGSAYDVPQEDESFDFALQNGVFHHIDDEDRAYKEMHRVVKKDGWIWVYTDGTGAISHDLWDASIDVLRDVPENLIISTLKLLNVATGKRYHLGDGLNAIYRHETWDGITSRLSKIGFGNFRRLKGGYETDFDHDVIEKDKYGKEKFGEGDLRLLAQKL